MATGKFSHTIAQIDAAVTKISGIDLNGILHMTKDEYNHLSTKESNTLYVVYSDTSFQLFYGARPLSGAGGASAGAFAASMAGGAGGAGSLSEPETL